MLKLFKPYFYIFWFNLKESRYYLQRSFFLAVIWLIRLSILFWFYVQLFSLKNNQINDTNLQTALTSMAIYTVFMGIVARNLFREINTDIQTGNLEFFLNKPVNYLGFKISKILGGQFLTFIIQLLGVIILVYFFTGLSEQIFNLKWLLWFALTFVLGNILLFGIYSIIGLMAIYL